MLQSRPVVTTLFLLSSVCVTALPGICHSAEADSGLTVTFAARGQELKRSEAVSYFGHAYMIIGVKTSSGVKEEILGFYPTERGGIIKGPGMLKAEYRCGPSDDCNPTHRLELLKQISKTKDSVTIPITVTQRQQIYGEVHKWDSKSYVGAGDKQIAPSSDKEYRLADQNCIDFIAAVAQSIGYPVPSRSLVQTPLQFLKELRVLVEQENKVRAAAHAAKEAQEATKTAQEKAAAAEEQAKAAEGRAEAADERATAAEKRAKAAEERAGAKAADAARQPEAVSIPAGWVRCACPDKHGNLGKFVNGVLYHNQDPTIRCPQ